MVAPLCGAGAALGGAVPARGGVGAAMGFAAHLGWCWSCSGWWRSYSRWCCSCSGCASAVQGGAAPARSTVGAALGGAAPLVVVLVALGMMYPLMMVGVWADSLFSPFQIKQKYNTICIDSTFHLEELQLNSEIC